MKAPISRFTIHGNSMIPTLQPGQDVLSINWFVNPKVGDVVIVNSGSFDYAQGRQERGNREIVKRIQKIIGDKVWLEGDNKAESTDSRSFGSVNLDQIIGKVVYGSNEIDCPRCEAPVIGIYGRKDAICSNCGFKLACCGEP